MIQHEKIEIKQQHQEQEIERIMIEGIDNRETPQDELFLLLIRDRYKEVIIHIVNF